MKFVSNNLNDDEEVGTAEYNINTHIGKLKVKAIEAKLTVDTEVFGKMDPFLEVEYFGKSFKTPVH